MSASWYGATIYVEVAFDDSPLTAVADCTWTDITAYVRRVSTNRGRSSELSTIGPGTATIMLDNLARTFDPLHSSGAYYGKLLPMAQGAADKIGVDAHYLVAQAALETGWGKSIIRQQDGTSSHNLFGIKAADWQGDSARVLTTEYVDGKQVKESASFRAYGSFEQSFNDYVSFLQNNDRYDNALDAAANPKRFVSELQRAGYATDPQYANKIAQIAKQMQTYQTVAAVDTATTRI